MGFAPAQALCTLSPGARKPREHSCTIQGRHASSRAPASRDRLQWQKGQLTAPLASDVLGSTSQFTC